MRLTAWLAVPVIATGCATALDRGEQRYREGDRRGALEIWREVPADDSKHAAVAARIEMVEAELDRLVIGYEEGAHIGEAEGRLAEAILDYRLALELQPDDAASLAHVQRLARELVSRKRSLRATYEHDRGRGDLDAARQSLARLRKLDPFDPEFETEERQLQAEISAEWERRAAQIRAQLADEVERGAARC
jgi:tetratricopeptide (TPR) repeat protein